MSRPYLGLNLLGTDDVLEEEQDVIFRNPVPGNLTQRTLPGALCFPGIYLEDLEELLRNLARYKANDWFCDKDA